MNTPEPSEEVMSCLDPGRTIDRGGDAYGIGWGSVTDNVLGMIAGEVVPLA